MVTTQIIPYHHSYESEFIALYKKIFAEPIYREYFEDDEVRETIYKYKVFLLIDSHSKKLLGFVAGGRLKKCGSQKEIWNILDNPSSTFYIAELAIDSAVRGQGLGYHLLSQYMNMCIEEGASSFALRTKKEGNPVRDLYERMGYKLLRDENYKSLEMEVSMLRTNGLYEDDVRVSYIKDVVTSYAYFSRQRTRLQA